MKFFCTELRPSFYRINFPYCRRSGKKSHFPSSFFLWEMKIFLRQQQQRVLFVFVARPESYFPQNRRKKAFFSFPRSAAIRRNKSGKGWALVLESALASVPYGVLLVRVRTSWFEFEFVFEMSEGFSLRKLGPHEFRWVVGRTAGFKKPVGQSGKWRSLVG